MAGENRTQESPENVPFFKLLNRYISVWLWSIILGSTVSGILMVPRPRELTEFGSASLILLVFMAVAYLAYVAGLIQLGVYLRRFIIPLVLTTTDDVSPSDEKERSYFGFKALPAAFQFLLIGITSHCTLMVTMGLLTILIIG